MKVHSIDLGFRSFLITPVFVAGLIGISEPGTAATIFHDSTLFLQVSNISQPALQVSTEADIDMIAIAGDSGKVEIQSTVSLLFHTGKSTANGFSVANSTVAVEGSRYLARKNVVSNLIGRFYFPEKTDFRFEITAYSFLWNFTENLTSTFVTGSGITSLFLQDLSSQKIISVFDFVGLINTGTVGTRNLDRLKFRKNHRVNVLDYTSQTFSDGEEEMLDFFLKASFHLSVNQDTELALFATTRSCFDTSGEGGICTVPEPSTAPGLLAGAIGLGGFGLLRKVMNRVIKLIF